MQPTSKILNPKITQDGFIPTFGIQDFFLKDGFIIPNFGIQDILEFQLFFWWGGGGGEIFQNFQNFLFPLHVWNLHKTKTHKNQVYTTHAHKSTTSCTL
jgi:hypothetical protein